MSVHVSTMACRAAGLVVCRFFKGKIEYLLLQSSYGENHWTPPKGHVDPGESDWETALRETKEEAGLDEADLTIYKDSNKTLEYIVKEKEKTVIYWLSSLIDPLKEIKLSDEHIAYKWLELSEAQELSGFQDFNAMLGDFHIQASQIFLPR